MNKISSVVFVQSRLNETKLKDLNILSLQNEKQILKSGDVQVRCWKLNLKSFWKILYILGKKSWREKKEKKNKNKKHRAVKL